MIYGKDAYRIIITVIFLNEYTFILKFSFR